MVQGLGRAKVSGTHTQPLVGHGRQHSYEPVSLHVSPESLEGSQTASIFLSTTCFMNAMHAEHTMLHRKAGCMHPPACILLQWCSTSRLQCSGRTVTPVRVKLLSKLRLKRRMRCRSDVSSRLWLEMVKPWRCSRICWTFFALRSYVLICRHQSSEGSAWVLDFGVLAVPGGAKPSQPASAGSLGTDPPCCMVKVTAQQTCRTLTFAGVTIC